MDVIEEKAWDWVDVETAIEKRLYEVMNSLLREDEFVDTLRVDLQELMGEAD
jgi:hypothetical protein